MKKVGIISIVFSITALAGNYTDESSVPQAIVQKFHQQFGESQELTWYQQDNVYQAIGEQAGNHVEAFYNTQAKCVEVDRKVTFETLPAEAQQKIKKEFGDGYTVASIYVVDKQNSNPIYKVRIRQGRLTYDMEFVDNNKADLAFHKKIIS